MQKILLHSLILSSSLALVACGGDSSSSSNNDEQTPAVEKTTSFSTTPNEFLAEFDSEKTSICYDIETNAEVDCDTTAKTWDVRFDKDFNIWINGGLHGEGAGGAFGPQTLSIMQEYKGGSKVPGYFKDQVSGIFLDSSWYAYSLNEQHKLWPNFRVYVIESNDKHYKVRLTSYYAAQDSNTNAGEPAPGSSGVITFDYEEITEGVNGSVVTKTLDASAGGFGAAADDPKNKYTYFSFAAGDVVELTDAEAESSDAWDIAFKRTSTKLNSSNRTLTTQGALAEAQADFYDENGEAIKDTFFAATRESEQAEFDGVNSASIAGLTFVSDADKPVLGSDWYNYDRTTHVVSANTDNHWVIRSAEEDGYAIFSATEITTSGRSAGSYKVNFYPEVTE